MNYITDEVAQIARKCSSMERLTIDEAVRLYRDAPLWLLGQLAVERKRRVSGESIYYNRNFHIEPTNVCLMRCKFCSYRRDADSPEAWDYTMEEMCDMARRYVGSGVTEVHIVGGVHPTNGIKFFEELIRNVKQILPNVCVKAFTAIELSKMIRKSGLSIAEGLERLVAAGMEAIPGGGAEIFAPHIREQICPEKGAAAEWFEVHDLAHRMGLRTNATILYGHIESLEDRMDHLNRLREQQDRTGGFNAFIPLKYRNANNSMGYLGEVSVVDDMRMMAVSRLFLDNIDHIKAYWVMLGKATTEMALAFGADDVDGTIDDTTKIYSMAGAEDQRPRMTISEIEQMAQRAGFEAVERDTNYNVVKK